MLSVKLALTRFNAFLTRGKSQVEHLQPSEEAKGPNQLRVEGCRRGRRGLADVIRESQR